MPVGLADDSGLQLLVEEMLGFLRGVPRVDLLRLSERERLLDKLLGLAKSRNEFIFVLLADALYRKVLCSRFSANNPRFNCQWIHDFAVLDHVQDHRVLLVVLDIILLLFYPPLLVPEHLFVFAYVERLSSDGLH